MLHLHHVLPTPLAGLAPDDSQLWLHDITFQPAHSYLIHAASGRGKSSLCSFLVGHRHDYQGTITLHDTDIATFSPARWTLLRQREVAILWQDLRLFPELTALDNIRLKNDLTHHQTPQRIHAWLDALDMTPHLDRPVRTLSYGQQQRVAFVRALCQPFSLFLADEPISHLDDTNAATLATILADEAAHQGATIITTSIGRHLPLAYHHSLAL